MLTELSIYVHHLLLMDTCMDSIPAFRSWMYMYTHNSATCHTVQCGKTWDTASYSEKPFRDNCHILISSKCDTKHGIHLNRAKLDL